MKDPVKKIRRDIRQMERMERLKAALKKLLRWRKDRA